LIFAVLYNHDVTLTLYIVGAEAGPHVGGKRSPPPLPATALAMAKLSAVVNDKL